MESKLKDERIEEIDILMEWFLLHLLFVVCHLEDRRRLRLR